MTTAAGGGGTDCDTICGAIREEICDETAKRFDIVIAFNVYSAVEMVAPLADIGVDVIKYRQTIQRFNEPTQKPEALVTAGAIEHGGDPALRAHSEAATVKTDVNENIRPVKDRSTGRIDGIVALIIALPRAMLHAEQRSIYEDRGLVFV